MSAQAWIKEQIVLHNETARRTGARLVTACGAVALPMDIGLPAMFTGERATSNHTAMLPCL